MVWKEYFNNNECSDCKGKGLVSLKEFGKAPSGQQFFKVLAKSFMVVFDTLQSFNVWNKKTIVTFIKMKMQ